MTVYVDELRHNPPSKRWPYGQSCHLLADTKAELHTFATKLQICPSWFKPHDRWPHYDLTANKRALAVREGAIEVKAREFVKRFMEMTPYRHSWKIVDIEYPPKYTCRQCGIGPLTRSQIDRGRLGSCLGIMRR